MSRTFRAQLQIARNNSSTCVVVRAHVQLRLESRNFSTFFSIGILYSFENELRRSLTLYSLHRAWMSHSFFDYQLTEFASLVLNALGTFSFEAYRASSTSNLHENQEHFETQKEPDARCSLLISKERNLGRKVSRMETIIHITCYEIYL